MRRNDTTRCEPNLIIGMSTKILLTVSSIALLLAGIALTFLPDETARLLSPLVAPQLVITVQILGALLFANGMINWLSKDQVIGGIYGRPLVVGNTAHFVTGGLALLRHTTVYPTETMITLTVLYLLFAVSFARLLFVSPSNP